MGNYAEKGITYDNNGNIKTLHRTNSSGGSLHNISYNYALSNNGNAVSSATINGTQTSNYVYDVAGNLTYDGYRDINIEYNILNLPQRIFAGLDEVSYIYKSDGTKLATKIGSSLTYYRGPFVYSGSTLDHIIHPEGIIRKSSGNYIYYFAKSDHVGGIRILCHGSGGRMVADQSTDYYPYGLSYENQNLNLNRYLYSGKEYQDQLINGKMLQLYDFGSRNYDPILGRWFNVDPALQFTNPYLYCANSPMTYVDPDGEFIIAAAGAITVATGGGAAAIYGAAGAGFIMGAGNTTMAGGDFGQIMISGISGAVVSGITMGVGGYVSGHLGNLTSNITSPILQQGLTYAGAGASGGFVGSTTNALLSGQSIGDALKSGVNGMAWGAAGGAVAGTISGTVSSLRNNTSKNPNINNREYAPRVAERAMQEKTAHNFPYSYDELILSTKPIPQSHGYNIYQYPGTMNGKSGYYEIGVTKHNIINHRFFRPGKAKY